MMLSRASSAKLSEPTPPLVAPVMASDSAPGATAVSPPTAPELLTWLMVPLVAVAPTTVVIKSWQNVTWPAVANAATGVAVKSPIKTPFPAVFCPTASHWNCTSTIVAAVAVVVISPHTSIFLPSTFINPAGKLTVATTVGTVVAGAALMVNGSQEDGRSAPGKLPDGPS